MVIGGILAVLGAHLMLAKSGVVGKFRIKYTKFTKSLAKSV